MAHTDNKSNYIPIIATDIDRTYAAALHWRSQHIHSEVGPFYGLTKVPLGLRSSGGRGTLSRHRDL